MYGLFTYMCFFQDNVTSQGHVSRWPGEVKLTVFEWNPEKKSIHIFLACHLYLLHTPSPKNRCVFLDFSAAKYYRIPKKKPTKRFHRAGWNGAGSRFFNLREVFLPVQKMTKFEAARAAHNATKAKLGCLRSRWLVGCYGAFGPSKR